MIWLGIVLFIVGLLLPALLEMNDRAARLCHIVAVIGVVLIVIGAIAAIADNNGDDELDAAFLPLWLLHDKLRRKFEDASFWIARHLPKSIQKWTVVNAALIAREPDRLAGDRYCGPDGLTYRDLHDAYA